MQPIQNARKRFHCLRAIAAGVVEQNYVAIMPLLFNPAKDDVCAGLRPVLWVNVLKDYEIIKIFRDFQGSKFTESRRASSEAYGGRNNVVARPVMVSISSCVAFSSRRICSGQQSARLGW